VKRAFGGEAIPARNQGRSPPCHRRTGPRSGALVGLGA